MPEDNTLYVLDEQAALERENLIISLIRSKFDGAPIDECMQKLSAKITGLPDNDFSKKGYKYIYDSILTPFVEKLKKSDSLMTNEDLANMDHEFDKQEASYNSNVLEVSEDIRFLKSLCDDLRSRIKERRLYERKNELNIDLKSRILKHTYSDLLSDYFKEKQKTYYVEKKKAEYERKRAIEEEAAERYYGEDKDSRDAKRRYQYRRSDFNAQSTAEDFDGLSWNERIGLAIDDIYAGRLVIPGLEIGDIKNPDSVNKLAAQLIKLYEPYNLMSDKERRALMAGQDSSIPDNAYDHDGILSCAEKSFRTYQYKWHQLMKWGNWARFEIYEKKINDYYHNPVYSSTEVSGAQNSYKEKERRANEKPVSKDDIKQAADKEYAKELEKYGEKWKKNDANIDLNRIRGTIGYHPSREDYAKCIAEHIYLGTKKYSCDGITADRGRLLYNKYGTQYLAISHKPIKPVINTKARTNEDTVRESISWFNSVFPLKDACGETEQSIYDDVVDEYDAKKLRDHLDEWNGDYRSDYKPSLEDYMQGITRMLSTPYIKFVKPMPNDIKNADENGELYNFVSRVYKHDPDLQTLLRKKYPYAVDSALIKYLTVGTKVALEKIYSSQEKQYEETKKWKDIYTAENNKEAFEKAKKIRDNKDADEIKRFTDYNLEIVKKDNDEKHFNMENAAGYRDTVFDILKLDKDKPYTDWEILKSIQKYWDENGRHDNDWYDKYPNTKQKLGITEKQAEQFKQELNYRKQGINDDLITLNEEDKSNNIKSVAKKRETITGHYLASYEFFLRVKQHNASPYGINNFENFRAFGDSAASKEQVYLDQTYQAEQIEKADIAKKSQGNRVIVDKAVQSLKNEQKDVIENLVANRLKKANTKGELMTVSGSDAKNIILEGIKNRLGYAHTETPEQLQTYIKSKLAEVKRGFVWSFLRINRNPKASDLRVALTNIVGKKEVTSEELADLRKKAKLAKASIDKNKYLDEKAKNKLTDLDKKRYKLACAVLAACEDPEINKKLYLSEPEKSKTTLDIKKMIKESVEKQKGIDAVKDAMNEIDRKVGKDLDISKLDKSDVQLNNADNQPEHSQEKGSVGIV